MWKRSPLGRVLIAGGLCFVLWAPCGAQEAGDGAPARAESKPPAVSAADAQSLVGRIKGVESPTFRAYLYARVSAWLSQSAGRDEALGRLAVEAAAAGLADLQQHERLIPPAPAGLFYGELLSVVNRHSPAEAERLKQTLRLELHAKATEADKAAGELRTALVDRHAEQGVARASRLVRSGAVPVMALHGEILRLFQIKSAALPELLAAALTLEEQKPGSLPLQNLFFLSPIYLRDEAPASLRVRFLAAAVKATRPAGPAASDPSAKSWAVELLRAALPHTQKLVPELYALAAAQLAALAPEAPQGEDLFARISRSADPLSEAITEANFAADPRLKRELFEVAARLARERGKLRQAVELLTSVEEDRRGMPEGYSARDETLDAIMREALGRGEADAARFAASKMVLPVNRAAAGRRLARHFAAAGDAPAAAETLLAAERDLADAPDTREKAAAYFGLAEDYSGPDVARVPAVIREGVRAANNITRPTDAGAREKFNWSLFPVADAAVRAFRHLARKDRAAALGLAETFQHQELKVAAALGAHSPEGR